MIDIKIKYGKKIIEAKHPSSYGEMTAEQFINVSQYLSSEMIGEKERINIIMSMLSLTDKQKNDLKFIPGYLIDELMKYHKFIFEDNPFDEWIIKDFEHNGIKYFGPDNNFRNVIWDEFVYVDTYLLQYCEIDDTDFADKIIAILYRNARENYNPIAADSKGDIREDFNENNFHGRELKFRSLDDKIKKSILFNLRALRSNLSLTYDFIFPHQEKEVDEKYKSKKKKINSHWGHITRKLCDFADLDKVGIMPMHNVLFELNERLKENRN